MIIQSTCSHAKMIYFWYIVIPFYCIKTQMEKVAQNLLQ